MEVYLVGGAVRDELLGLPVQEYDWVVVGSSPEQMQVKGYKPVGKDFPVFLHPKTHEEFALARTERKKGRGYYGFEIHASPDVTLEEDLLRRDLTINAMAKTKTGKIIDPYGGQKDLEAKVLRHVSSAFSEDPLRVLRVARFAAKLTIHGFSIADETLELMKNMVNSGELKELTTERIWQETHTALQTSSPSMFFKILHEVDALVYTHAPISKVFSNQSAYSYGMLALEEITKTEKNACVRFAALVGGLYLESSTAAEKDIQALCTQLTLPNVCKELLTHTVRLQTQCHNAKSLNEYQLLDLLNNLDTRRKPERFQNLLRVFAATHKIKSNKNAFPQAQYIEAAAKLINELDVQKIISKKKDKEGIALAVKQKQVEILKGYIQKA